MDTPEAVRAYISAISNPSEATAGALAPHLAENATVVGIVAPGASRDAVLEAIKAPNASRLLAAAQWTEPESVSGHVVMDGILPAGSLLGGLSVEITLAADGRIQAVGQSI